MPRIFQQAAIPLAVLDETSERGGVRRPASFRGGAFTTSEFAIPRAVRMEGVGSFNRVGNAPRDVRACFALDARGVAHAVKRLSLGRAK